MSEVSSHETRDGSQIQGHVQRKAGLNCIRVRFASSRRSSIWTSSHPTLYHGNEQDGGPTT